MTVANDATGDDSTDRDLIHRVVLRDEHALSALYDRHSGLVYSLVARVLRSSLEAEEVLQEAFVRVWSSADTYEPRLGSPRAWMMRIGRECAMNRVKATGRRRFVDASQPEPPLSAAAAPTATATPDEVAPAGALVRDALNALPAPQRALIEAAFFDGHTHQDLTERSGIPAAVVKGHIRAGLLALRSYLS
jgi:RNA polymerase sigma-70 factor (ECF subfamily)